ncbi:MAG TPA: hypothetical protein VEC37_08325, partial [Bacillota bacterium]|nr:hypothetical protein [Bacillota bacterium]
MNPEKVKDFERSIHEDPEFAKQVAFYPSAVGALKDKAASEKKARFRELYDKNKIHVADTVPPAAAKMRNMRIRFAAAASFIAAALLIGFIFLSSPSPQKMATRYINREMESLPATMSVSDSIQSAKNLYNRKEYEPSLLIFEKLLAENPEDAEVRELAGIAALRLNRYDKALEHFGLLSETPDLISNPGPFYSALTLMK